MKILDWFKAKPPKSAAPKWRQIGAEEGRALAKTLDSAGGGGNAIGFGGRGISISTYVAKGDWGGKVLLQVENEVAWLPQGITNISDATYWVPVE